MRLSMPRRPLRQREKLIYNGTKLLEASCLCQLDGPGCIIGSNVATYFARPSQVQAYRWRFKKVRGPSALPFCRMLWPPHLSNS